jgi:hypothetical protein
VRDRAGAYCAEAVEFGDVFDADGGGHMERGAEGLGRRAGSGELRAESLEPWVGPR